jgi:hypothetical protein
MKLIYLSQGLYAKVDDADYEWLMQWKWYAVKEKRKKSPPKWYAVRNENGLHVYMHRAILNAPPGIMTDHTNGESLDNQRDNLRSCTNAENQHNQRVKTLPKTSKYKGVSWRQRDVCWQTHIMVNNKSINLGNYDSEIDAAYAYDISAREHFGAFARTNFENPPECLPVRRFAKKTSQYVGVYWNENRQKWQSSITIEGKRRFLGRWSPRIVDGIDQGELDAYKALQAAQMEAVQLRISNAKS